MADSTPAPDDSYRDDAEIGSVVGGGISAYSQFEAGRTNQAISRINANNARLRGDQEQQAGQFAANRRLAVQEQLTGATLARQGSSGTVAGAGTNGTQVSSQEAGSAMDQFLLKLNAGRQRDASEIQASGDILQGDMARRTGESSAISTLVNTSGNVNLLNDPYFDPKYSHGLGVG